MKIMIPSFLGLVCVAALSCTATAADERKLPPPSQQTGLTFDQQIKPLFVAACVACHGAEKQKAGIRLDTREAALKSKNGRAVIPGKSAQSLVVISAAGAAAKPEENMPPQGKGQPLTREQVGLIRAWIDQGAK